MKKRSCSATDLQSLLDSIKSSDVVENRVQLLTELGEFDLSDKSALNSVLQSLILFWEDFTCLDISQCTLNKAILHVAAQCLELDVSGCLVQFLLLGIKANTWCRKHLQMTLMSTEDSPEEEHSSFFYQLVLDLLNYSAASYSALARYVIPTNKELMVSLESFISEQLTLVKDLVSETKKIQTLGLDLLKGAQAALDAVTRLCRVYCNGVDWDVYLTKTEVEKGDCKEAEHGDLVIVIINCLIEKLCELGIVAANGGGSLVSLLNMSWKGVVSLLQLGKGALAVKVNIKRVVVTLISLASDSLRGAAETWSLSMNEVSVAEAKRIFLPVKFYLINAVRIISQYQTQALSLYKDIALCVVVILTYRISLSKLKHLNSASEVLAEILEPTSLHLLNSLLNSAQVKREDKFQILDWLFNNESVMSSAAEVTTSLDSLVSLNAILSISSNTISKENILLLGRVSLFVNLLKGAADLDDDVRLGIARKLGWLLDALIEEDVYPFILVLKTPAAYGSAQNQQPTSQPMFSFALHAMKTFLITVSSSPTWNEIESFLIDNLFHPHFLCWEIVTELWCFILRHADSDTVNDVIEQLCSLLRLTPPESAQFPDSAGRKIARLICIFVTYGPQSMVDRVYSSLFDHEKSQCPSSVHMALLVEGFPLNLLSDNNRSMAKQRIVTQYFDFMESFEDKLPKQSSSGVYGAPVFALCASMQSLQVSLSDTDTKTLKFLVTIIHKYKTSADTPNKDYYRRLLGELLGIVSNMKHLYSFDEMEEVILELKNLFISRPAQSDTQLFLCKPNLAYFMAGLGHVELPDSEESARSLAAWELYHMLLKERHWAFVHLGITAFGYFAARTSCNELWRFVPQDAALSFDLESGNEADEERFMSELKAFLDKERACQMMQASPDQFVVLVKEGQMLKEIVQKYVKKYSETIICDVMEIDDERQPSKKRKFPDGICRGVKMLQSGLKIMVDGISKWQQNQQYSSDEQETFMAHFSRLEDVIAHLVSLADSG